MNLELGLTRQVIDAASDEGMIRNQLAYVLATALWETNWTFRPVREAYWLSEDWRRANLDYYPWYGRGLVQLTWEDNYARADDELELEGGLVARPDLALQDGIAVRVILAGMAEGWFSGHRLEDYMTLQSSDYVGARAIVNGSDHAADIASLACEYEDALLAEGYGVEETDGGRPPVRPVRPPMLRVVQMLAERDARAQAELRAMREDLDELRAWAGSYGAGG